jgi:hypothetical protein
MKPAVTTSWISALNEDESDTDSVDSMDDDDEINDDDEIHGGDGDIKSKTITACVAVARMLIKSPAITRKIDGEWVRRSFWNVPEELTDRHFEFIATVVNQLRPYYPQDVAKGVPAPRHILLTLNMVMLANYLLAKLGYHVGAFSK